MSVSFSRSLRALKADSFRPSMVGLIITMVLIVAWLAWFFLVPIPIYETSQSLQLIDQSTITAQFDAQVLGRIQPGQSALLNFTNDGSTQPRTISALVMQVPGLGRQDQVELYALTDQFTPPINLSDVSLTSVEVEIERVPLSTMVLRASGHLVDTPQVSRSPADLTEYNQYR